MSLIKITCPTAAEIAGKYKPHPEAQALLQPTHTPTQYAAALQKGSFSQDHIHFLAHGMPERESVDWACKSSAKVADKLEPSDKSALGAAREWVKNPTPANQSAAAAAAAKTNFQGPGAWAAQGAAWAKTPGAPNLTGHAVAGSVMLAAVISAGKIPAPPKVPPVPKVPIFQQPKIPQAPKPPAVSPPALAERVATAKVHAPFIELGHGIASGQISIV